VRDLASRQLSPHVSSLPVSFYATLGNAGFGVAIFLFGGTGTAPWVAISAMQAFLLFGASVSILFGYIFAVSAMRIGALAIVTPFRYTSILFALLLGLVVFGEWPDFLTLIGGGIVVFSGIFTLYREQVAARRAKQNPLEESDEPLR
jgi:S-adenosylmethionine uptake transporter